MEEELVASAFLAQSDQARAHQPTRTHPTKRGERVTYARPDRGNESEMLWAVLETTKERRVACCRNTRSDEGVRRAMMGVLQRVGDGVCVDALGGE